MYIEVIWRIVLNVHWGNLENCPKYLKFSKFPIFWSKHQSSSFYFINHHKLSWREEAFSSALLLFLKWVFTKIERGCTLSAKNYRWWSLLILLLFVASIRRKLLKATHTEERSVHINSDSCNILRYSTIKKINLIRKKIIQILQAKFIDNTHLYIVHIS